MEDYIYILIGVIWLAASVYKATQKKKKQAASPGKEPSTQNAKSGVSEARSLLEELLGGQDVRIPAPEEDENYFQDPEIITAEDEPPRRSFQNEYAKMGLKGLETGSGIGTNSPERIEFIDEMKGLEKKVVGQKKIDLRKAIIYSAILERPYT